MPKELSADEAKHVLGGQGQIWTEYMPDPKRVEYMAWPRLIALAYAFEQATRWRVPPALFP